MREILNKHRKVCIIAVVAVAAALLFLYLRVMLLSGLWHGDAFLYKQADGSFAGSDFYADYKMGITPTDYGEAIDFTENEKTNHYQVRYNENDLNANVEVLENGTVICRGRAVKVGNYWHVIDESTGSSDMISVRVGGEAPTEEELFPNYSMLYSWSVSDGYDTRGNPYMLFIIALLAIILFLDIKFPDLFWILEHRLDVDGGEPSDWYRFGQKVSRIVLAVGILICVVLTFTIH